MQAISNLCNRTILLENGEIIFNGQTEEAVDTYLNSASELNEHTPLFERKDRMGTGEYKVAEIWFTDEKGKKVSGLYPNKRANIHVMILPENKPGAIDAYISLIISHMGIRLFTLGTAFKNKKIELNGPTEVCWKIEKLPLIDSVYQCSINIQKNLYGRDVIDSVQKVCNITVFDVDYWGTGRKQAPGIDKIFVDFDFSVNNKIGK